MKLIVALEKSDIISVGPGVEYAKGGIMSMSELMSYDKPKTVNLAKKDAELPTVRRTYYKGLPIDIQLDAGMTANGKDQDGIPWKVTYKHPYGEVPTTQAVDHDPVDVYLGNADSDLVYIVHQLKKNGRYDEDKCFLGFESPMEATRCYFEHGPKWGFGSLETLTFDQFLNGYLAANRVNGIESGPRLFVTKDAMF